MILVKLPAALPALALAATAALAGCGTSGAGGPGSGGGDRPTVVTAAYPLDLLVRSVGGEHVTTLNLAKPGVEPHDLELTAKNVAAIDDASLVVYSKGFSTAVDTAAKEQAGERAFDVSGPARLTATPSVEPVGEGDAEQHHADDGHDHGSEPGAVDQHFWLDPQRYAAVATAVATRLGQVDPANRADYERNARAFNGRLTTLDRELVTGLRSCTRKELVTSHAAFGYLAQRTGLSQVPIAVSPGQEPDPAALGRISTYAKAHGVTTIYTEPLVSSDFADAIARSTGARTATLDPVESITDRSAGGDYFAVMRSNLSTLRTGQGCS